MPTQKIFTDLGGEFLTPYFTVLERVPKLKGFLFDWDGVFNSGIKSENFSSPFSEADSMGVNMLRFSHWLKYGEIPFTAIITGLNNQEARALASREHFTVVYSNVKFKQQALKHIESNFNLSPQQLAFTFDDILDFSVAEHTLLRFMIRRNASPLTTDYVRRNSLADYISAQEGGHHAVREVCELVMSVCGNVDETYKKRTIFQGDYKQYVDLRNKIETRFFSLQSANNG